MDAYDGHGYAFLYEGSTGKAAVMFERALELFPDHARSLIALAAAHRREGRAQESAAALAHAWKAIDELRANDRTTEASIASALALVAADRHPEAVAVLDQLLSGAPPGFAGWTIPIEPLFSPLRGDPLFAAILAQLSARAR
jgi:tetratricopeptide (TPR) repeat protein